MALSSAAEASRPLPMGSSTPAIAKADRPPYDRAGRAPIGARVRGARRHEIRDPHRPHGRAARRDAQAVEVRRRQRLRLVLRLRPLPGVAAARWRHGLLRGDRDADRGRHGHHQDPARQRRLLRRLPQSRPAGQVAHHDRPSLERARGLRARRRLARRRGQGVRHAVPDDRPARGHARGVRADHAPAARSRAAARELRGQALPAWPTPPTIPSRCSPASPSGSAAAARSARCARPRSIADGWNGAYIGPTDWKHKCDVLDRWCETEGRDPKTIMRTVNLGFYLGVDAKGAARARGDLPQPLRRAAIAPTARATCAAR